MEELNQHDQQQDASASSATGEPAVATGQASSASESQSTPADAQPVDAGQQPASSESTDESQTGTSAGSTTGGDAPSDTSAQSEPHPVREYSDILRAKFQRLEAVALSDIEHLLDLIEEHL